MPKIIENLDSRILEEARKQIEVSGYSSMTIRSVAAACGIGVGTVYHYFPSKDALIASFMLEDWKKCTDVICSVSANTDSPDDVVRSIYDQLHRFAAQHHAIVKDETAASGFAGSFGKYHAVLRGQLSAPLRKFCGDDFTADFIAEALLTWTMAGKDFEEICSIIQKLF